MESLFGVTLAAVGRGEIIEYVRPHESRSSVFEIKATLG